MMNDAAIVAHISQLPHSRANFKQLLRELGAKGDSRMELEAALTRLPARGELIELKSGQYVVTARTREFAVGRLNLHRDGYGFLISERPIPGIAGDIFIPPEAAEKAMHGDHRAHQPGGGDLEGLAVLDRHRVGGGLRHVGQLLELHGRLALVVDPIANSDERRDGVEEAAGAGRDRAGGPRARAGAG